VAINIGARLQEKQLEASDYHEIIQALEMLKLRVVLTYGPSERPLAEQSAQNTSAKLAPKTDLLELAALFHQARAVITCDTGPMHLAVALGSPTCGIFVSTPPERYGYQGKGHTCVDARNGFNAEAQGLVSNWCGKILRG
jgi:ADP-heptose:LPS heptosyltransferase